MKRIQLFSILISLILCSTSTQAQKIFELMQTDGVNLKEAQDEAATYFAKVGTGKGTGYKLFKRWEYHATLDLQEDGTILSKRTHAAAIKSSKNIASRSAKTSSLATISSSNWTELGPLAITRGNSGNSPGIGRITTIYVDPINQQLIYVGSPGGGLWKSTNGGSSWTPLGDQFESMSIWAIEVDPTNSNTVYIGNEIGQLLKSTDGGNSFTTIFDINNGVLKDILINPNNTDELYIALPTSGLYHTTNGGSTWTKVIEGDIEDVMFKPGSTSTIYACGDDFYRSTNSGDSFSKIIDGIQASTRMKLAVSIANSNYVYIVQKHASTSGFGYLYQSTDSGASFTAQSVRADVDYIGAQSGRDMAITVSDTNVNEVHIGGLHMYKSIDGGVSFTKETTGSFAEASNSSSLSFLHADIEVLQYINGFIYVGCDGGIYKSTDAGASFTDLSTGLGIQQFYRIANSASNKNVIIGGSQDNGSTIKSDSSHQWMQYGGGDGMDCMIDPNDENIIYGSFQYGGLIKSIDGGATTLTPTYYVRPPENNGGNWVTPLGMDPNNSSRIYAGYSDLYRHDNAGITGSGDWVNASSNITFSAKLNYIETCPSNSDVIYVATTNTLYKSTNITTVSPTWSELSLPDDVSLISDIAVNSYDENRIAVSSGKYLFLSTDGGANWTIISDDFFTTPIRSIALDHSNSQGIYAAINGVVYYKNNNLSTWIVFSENLPNVNIMELELYYDKEIPEDSRIRVGTYGRGLWESPLYDDSDAGGSIESSCSDGASAYITIQAEDFCEEYGTKTENNDTTLGYIENGDFIRFNNVAFGNNGAIGFEATVASALTGGNIEIRLDSKTGTLVGTCSVTSTGGWSTWSTTSCDINGANGDHDIYVVFTGNNGYLFNIDSFKFTEAENICSSAGVNAYTIIQAEDFCEEYNTKTENNDTTLGYIENGSYIRFNDVAFGNTGAIGFEATVACASSGGNIEIRLDSQTGTLVGTSSVTNTGGWNTWTTTSVSISGATGDHDIYLVFTGNNGYLFNIDSFKFIQGSDCNSAGVSAYTTIQVENFCEEYNTKTENNDTTLGYIENGSYIRFNDVAFGNTGAIGFEATVASASTGGNIEIRLDSQTGDLVGICSVNNTGGWSTWTNTSCNVNETNGYHDVYLVFTGNSGYLFNIDSFQFIQGSSNKILESELNKISLFPNPVSTTLHIQLPTEGEKTVISISNLLGQVISTNTFDTHEGLNLLKVNIEGVAAGLYPVTILKGATKLVKNIVIE